MANGEGRLLRSRLVGCLAVLAAFAGGCASPEQVRDATHDVNAAFRTEYEAILAQNGTRIFSVAKAEAYDAVRVAMARLGMIVEAQDPVLLEGKLEFDADPAPLPVDPGEGGSPGRLGKGAEHQQEPRKAAWGDDHQQGEDYGKGHEEQG